MTEPCSDRTQPLEILVETSGEDRCSGTFDFCAKCPAHANCCTRVQPGGEIEIPVLFENDVAEIRRYTGERAEAFSCKRPRLDNVRWMRTGENGCCFYRAGKCEIYDVRPIDCRLFPMDILEEPDGRLMLIAYSTLCPVGYDPKRYVAHARDLLMRLGDNVRDYARSPSPGMDDKPHVVLGDVAVILRESGNSPDQNT